MNVVKVLDSMYLAAIGGVCMTMIFREFKNLSLERLWGIWFAMLIAVVLAFLTIS